MGLRLQVQSLEASHLCDPFHHGSGVKISEYKALQGREFNSRQGAR